MSNSSRFLIKIFQKKKYKKKLLVYHIIPGGGIISSRWGRKSSGEDNGKRENGMEGKGRRKNERERGQKA